MDIAVDEDDLVVEGVNEVARHGDAIDVGVGELEGTELSGAAGPPISPRHRRIPFLAITKRFMSAESGKIRQELLIATSFAFVDCAAPARSRRNERSISSRGHTEGVRSARIGSWQYSLLGDRMWK